MVGVFMDVQSTDTRFAEWDLLKLGKLNERQMNAFFCPKGDIADFPDFTEDELKSFCLNVPCRVELFHSNVCHGVEQSWPKRLYKRAKFQDLMQIQKNKLWQKMERNAVALYNKYVDPKRLARRRQNRTNRAMAPIYEARIRKNRFNRIKALGDVQHETENESEAEISLQTVINTRTYKASQTPKRTSVDDVGENVKVKLSDNDDDDSQMIIYSSFTDESEMASVADSNDSIHQTSLTIKNDSDVDFDERYNDLSESIVTSTDEIISQETQLTMPMPDMMSQEVSGTTTPLFMVFGARVEESPFRCRIEDSMEVNSLDFLSDEIHPTRTSTQQKTQ